MEYEECFDCGEDYFFEDLQCEFEEEKDDKFEDQEEVVDNTVFVLNNQNLQRELANMLVIDPSEAPHNYARRIQNVAQMYMRYIGGNPDEQEYMSAFIRPVVSIKKYIYMDGADPVGLIYNNEHCKQDILISFVKNFPHHIDNVMRDRLPAQHLFRPFVMADGENTTKLVQDIDAVYHSKTQISSTPFLVEDIHVFKDENVVVTGVANMFGVQPYDDRTRTTTIVTFDEYMHFLKQLVQGDEVNVIAHRHVVGLGTQPNHKAVITQVEKNNLTLQLKGDSTVQLTMDISLVESVCNAPICIAPIQEADAQRIYNKHDFIKGGGYVVLTSPQNAKLILPTVEEWMYVHSDTADNIFSVKDVYRFFGEGPHMKRIETEIKDRIGKNLAAKSREMKRRGKSTYAHFLNRPSSTKVKWQGLLDFQGFPNAHAFTDTAFSRFKHLQDTNRLQRQLIKLVSVDAKSVVPSPTLGIGASQVDPLADALDAFERVLKGKKGKDLVIFQSIEDADQQPPTEKGNQCFVWQLHVDKKIKSRHATFLVMKCIEHDDVKLWGIELEETVKFCKANAKGLVYDVKRHQLRVENREGILLNNIIHEALVEIRSERVSTPRVFEQDIKRSSLTLDLSCNKPIELEVEDHGDLVDMEGDEDLIDDSIVNNLEFGVHMTILPKEDEEMESDDEDDPEEDENSHRAHVAKVLQLDSVNERMFGSYTDPQERMLAELIYRMANILRISLTKQDLNIITKHTFNSEDYKLRLEECIAHDQAMQRRYEKELEKNVVRLRELQAKTNKDSAFFEVQKQSLINKLQQVLTDQKEQAYGKMWQSIAFHVVALLCIIVHMKMPDKVVIDKHPEHKGVFGLKGFPLLEEKAIEEDEFDANEFTTYMSHLLVKELKVVENFARNVCAMAVAQVQPILHKKIADILDVTAALKDAVHNARGKYLAFAMNMHKAKTTMRSYPVWNTFRPLLNSVSEISYDGTDRTRLTASYISRLSKIVSSHEVAKPIKLGFDKQAAQLNSCCTQQFGNEMNYWNFFANDKKVQHIATKLKATDKRVKGTLTGACLTKSYKFNDTVLSGMSINQPSKVIKLGPCEDNSMDLAVITEHSMLVDTLVAFIDQNPFFEADETMASLKSLPNDDQAWNKLSDSCKEMVDKLSHSLPALRPNLSAFYKLLMSDASGQSAANQRFSDTMVKFIMFDLRQTLGRLASRYLAPNANKAMFKKGEHNYINELLVKELPDRLFGDNALNMSDHFRNNLENICKIALSGAHVLSKLLLINTNDKIPFLAGYIIVLVLRSLQKAGGADAITADVIDVVMEDLLTKHSLSSTIKRVEGEYEKQREKKKQDELNFMKSLEDSVERRLAKDLKERGIAYKNLGNKALENVDGPPPDNRDEREKEISNDIKNNPGENGDDNTDD